MSDDIETGTIPQGTVNEIFVIPPLEMAICNEIATYVTTRMTAKLQVGFANHSLNVDSLSYYMCAIFGMVINNYLLAMQPAFKRIDEFFIFKAWFFKEVNYYINHLVNDPGQSANVNGMTLQ